MLYKISPSVPYWSEYYWRERDTVLESVQQAITESNLLTQPGQFQLDPVIVTEYSTNKIFSQEDNQEDLCKEMDAIADNINQCIISDKQFLLSAAKFTKTYCALTKKSSNAYLVSAFYNFGWGFGGTTSSQSIQAESAGR